MNKMLILSAALATLSGPAIAADMFVKAPPRYAAPWIGCYVGLSGGYGWNHGRSTYNDPNTTPDPINFIPNPAPRPTALFIPHPSPAQDGWLGGATVGCNWQIQQWVFGIEGDVSASGISGSQTTVGPQTVGDAAIDAYFLGPAGPVTANPAFVATAYESVSVRWLSTLRARAGFAVQDRLLLFATAGLAVGGVRSQGNVNIIIPAFPGSQTLWSGSNSETKVGLVVGGGAEWAFTDRWTAKAEYLWYDLGRISHPLDCVTNPFGCGGGGAYTTLGTTRSSVSGSIVRLGVNYKLN
jgi:outer membrane immunogenic protein